MSEQPQVLVIGEALMDLVIPYGKTIEEAQAVPGGSLANVSLALGRLGRNVTFITQFGDDDYGLQIRKRLEDSNVHVVNEQTEGNPTSTAAAHLDEDGAATYDFSFTWDLPSPIQITDQDQIVHCGSIASVVAPGGKTVLEALRSAKDTAVTTYDPNARPALMGTPEDARKIVEDFVGASTVVKVSDEDLEWLYPDADPIDAVALWFEHFPVSLIVLTRGGEGPIAWTRKGVNAEVTPEPVVVVDTVGAGDTFMGGLIDALWRRNLRGEDGAQKIADLDKETLTGLLEDASRLANIVVQRRGANPPWLAELQ